MDNNGKVALITGASAGIGKDIAKRMLGEGYTVYGVARRLNKMDDLQILGAHTMTADTSDDESIKRVVDTIIEDQQHLDVLINNAGWGYYTTIESGEIERAKEMFDVNYFGYIRCIQHVLPHMRGQRSGKIVNISSLLGRVALPVTGWYSSTKHAIEAMSDSLRLEIGSFGIDVIIVELGGVKTEFDAMVSQSISSVDYPEDYHTLITAFQDFRRAHIDSGEPCKSVSDAVLEALATDQPEPRYICTQDARDMIGFRTAQGDKEFDKVVLGKLGLL